MATLAPIAPQPAHGVMSSRRYTNGTLRSGYANGFASPTESEFSVGFEEAENVRNWDENGVADWLRNINAGQYVEIFKENNITGENLMDLDTAMLKEIGVKKIGDRVRIGSQAKLFRHQEYRRQRSSNRDSFAAFDSSAPTPPSSGSPRLSPRSARGGGRGTIERRAPSPQNPPRQSLHATAVTVSRPGSPFFVDPGPSHARVARAAGMSPLDLSGRDSRNYYQSMGTGTSTRFNDAPLTARTVTSLRQTPPTPQTATRIPTPHSRANSLTVDVATANGGLTHVEKPWIRVIYDDGQSAIISTEKCRSYEDIVLRAIQKGKNLHHDGNPRNYCFYTLDGTEAITVFCREIDEFEVLRICNDNSRKERDRLLLRKTDAGKPQGLQLRNAAHLAQQQAKQEAAQMVEEQATRSQMKIERLIGEPLPARAYPMSPASAAERERHLSAAVNDLEGTSITQPPQVHPRARKVRELHGARPTSELVVADPATYFPDAEPSEIERLNRMSVYRSQRVSRALKTMSIATSRLSMMSDSSAISGIGDAPPVPNIAESAWFSSNAAQGAVPRPRPFSIIKSGYRDSVASSVLDTLEEQSPEVDTAQFEHGESPLPATTVTDPVGNTVQPSFLSDQTNSSPLDQGNSFTSEQLTQALAEDGEGPDDELVTFLQGAPYDDIKYIRGKLIGQGSFGSVYLALHAVTAELMAVKQVELPSASGGVDDKKKNNMVEALKREIALLRELKHPNIVHYLGSSNDDSNLNIFLEYVPGGSIAKMLVDYGSLSEQIVTIYVRQILIGLAYLHSQNVIHRDIKGANILVDNKGRIKISDFGISKRVQDSKTLLDAPAGAASKGRGAFAANRVSLQGSVFWMAPEVVQQTAYTRKADIWSLGCLVVEMLTGKHPHPTLSQLQALYKIGGARGGEGSVDPSPDIPEHTTGAAREFLKATFRVQHEERPEAGELLEMAWLRQANEAAKAGSVQ